MEGLLSMGPTPSSLQEKQPENDTLLSGRYYFKCHNTAAETVSLI